MRFNFDALKHGTITQRYRVEVGDDLDLTVEDREDNVTLAVRELVRQYEEAVKAKDKLAQELTDIKNRRWWDEIDVATDRITGNTVVIRTHYELEMKGMRLEVTPDVMSLMRPSF